MIKSDHGNIVVEGDGSVVEAEFTMLVMVLFESIKEKISEDKAEKKVLELAERGIKFQKLQEANKLDDFLRGEILKGIVKMFDLMEKRGK